TPTPATPTPATPTPATPTPATPTPATPTPIIGPEKIKVGMIASVTGGLATFGRIQKIIAEEVVKTFNSEGGIYLKDYGRKLPIDLTLVDDESNPSRGTELAMRLVSDEELVAIICCSYAHISTPVAKVTERYGVPLLNAATPAEFFAAAGPWNYSWGHSMGFERYYEAFLSFLSEYRNQTNEKFGLVLSDNIIGRTDREILTPKIERERYTIFDAGFYQEGTTDFTSIILKLKDEVCDIVWFAGSPTDFMVFRRQCLLLGYKPKVLPGVLTRREDVEALGGDLALGVICHLSWHQDYPFPLSVKYKELWKKYLEQGVDFGPTGAYYFTIWYILKDALERVGRLDRQALNKAIGEINIIGACGPVRYDPVTHVSSGYLCLGQWMKTTEGNWVIQPIWSEVPEVKVVKPIFPLP
ncbi:MAG: ABC transporter substrate-binding protein, partial [Candidatus Bathyarchaeia archaeon]